MSKIEIDVNIDDDFIAVFDRAVDIWFENTPGYVSESIVHALAHPTSSNRHIRKAWHVTQITMMRRRRLLKETQKKISVK